MLIVAVFHFQSVEMVVVGGVGVRVCEGRGLPMVQVTYELMLCKS